ncbi:hypothetical protein J2X36_004322 [Methylobacterium sp. BE186]|uniref:hypothetical protein n=1 Tax=Methylobacterium sp. BE186 TaxID=2817715 RepID=UPI0028643225|nr:hypothetical protein [Methylobacterium sp. BE186]MDR7039546.1 hypothetical protein [Methylobacterium sp. BE186]
MTVTTDHGVITILAGNVSGTLEVQTLDDRVHGPDPDVTVKLLASSIGTVDPARAIGHVLDDDPAPAPQNRAYFGSLSHDVHSPAGEVYALYDAVLQRTPEADGQLSWTQARGEGLPLHDLAEARLKSEEGQSHLAQADDRSFVEARWDGRRSRLGCRRGPTRSRIAYRAPR